MLQIEFDFLLPKGFLDESGNVYREGTMRLATALDEIAPLQDPRVRLNEAYVTILVLARVITRLGAFRHISAEMIEKLFSADFAYLETFYRRINGDDNLPAVTICPHCRSQFEIVSEV